MLYREIIAVFSLSHKNDKNVYCDINVKCMKVKSISIYTDREMKGLMTYSYFAIDLNDSRLRDKVIW
jgi:hypothetical protein